MFKGVEMRSVFDQFLEEEVSPSVRKLIEDAMARHSSRPEEVECQFEFDIFDVSINFQSEVVTIASVLDASSAGEQQLPLHEFLRILGST